MNEEELGKVASVYFGLDKDHGFLTFYININFGNTEQSFGGYTLDEFDKAQGKRIGHAAGTDLILRLLETFEVNCLEDIKGKVVCVFREEHNGQIIGLKTPKFEGNKVFMIKDWQEACKDKK